MRDIDAVIFATNSMWHEEFYTLPAVHNVLVELGMEQAELTGLFLSGCANSVDALRVAANMIHAEGRKAVLVLLADAVEPINGERILTGDYAIMGDAAVSFVVQPPGAGELDVVGLSKKSNARLGSLTLGSAEYVFGALAGMRMALDEACKQAGVSVDEISRAYMSNLDLKLCHSSMWALGIGGDRWSARGVSEYGHCFASDTFLNFVVQGEDEPVLSDSCVLLYSQSIACWGSTILRTRRDWPRS